MPMRGRARPLIRNILTLTWEARMTADTGTVAASGRLVLGLEARGMLMALAAAVIWASYMAFARAGLTVGGLEAIDVVAMRFGVAGLMMLPWLLRNNPVGLAGVGIGRSLVLTAAAGPVFLYLSAGGYSFAPLAHGAVLQPATVTLTGIVFSALLVGDRPSPRRLAGIAVMLVGLACVAGSGFSSGDARSPIGDVMFVAAGFLWGTFAVFQKRWSLNAMQTTAVVCVMSAVAFMPGYLTTHGPERLLALPLGTLIVNLVIHGVLSGVVAVIAFARAVEILGPGRVSLFPALVPALAILIGLPVTGESPTPMELAGVVLVMGGLGLALSLFSRLRP